MRKSAGAVLGGIVAVLISAGCGSSEEGTAAPAVSSSPSVAAEVPSGFDPCVDVTQEVLDSEGLHGTGFSTDKDKMQRGDIKWNGCSWVVTDGYAASVSATNLTVDMVRGKKYDGAEEVTIAGRTAIYGHYLPAGTRGRETGCTMNVQMSGGSLEIGVDNNPSAPKTGDQYSCDIVMRLAEKVVPLIPSGA